MRESVDSWLEVLDAQWSQRRTEVGFSVSITSVLGVAILLVLGMGSYKFILGAVTLGTVVAFYSYVTRIFEPVSTAMELYARSERMLASARRVLEVLTTEPAVPDSGWVSEPILKLRHGINLVGVDFAYRQGHPAVRKIDLHIAAGEAIAIAGASGSGKSTLARLLVRLANPTAGRVLVDRRDATEYTLRALRETICYVPQTPVLFRGTIRENLLYANPAASKTELERVVEAAQLSSVLERLVGGLDHPLGSGGSGLSGGEQQRLAIARALLRNSAVLILDESTSALDVPTETAIFQAVRRFRRDMTFVVISHRLKSLSWVDRFVLLEAGEIAAVGDHSKLQRESWLYRALFDAEAEGTDRGVQEPLMSPCKERVASTARAKN
jgi:ABC-type multidrug transport system fused ATPase/permease subunit